MVLYFIFAHFIGDFVCQTDKLVRQKNYYYKKKRHIKEWLSFKNPLLKHGFILFIIMQSAHLFYGTFRKVIIVSLLNVIVHMIIDHCKLWLANRYAYLNKNFVLFLIDQGLHLLSIVLLVPTFNIMLMNKYIYIPNYFAPKNVGLKLIIPQISTEYIMKGIVFIVFSYFTAYIISHIMKQFMKSMINIPKDNDKQSGKGNNPFGLKMTHNQASIGKYIGILERMLIMIFVSQGQYSALGLILAGKSLARVNELKDKRFAEYYLIGTLLSFLVGVVGGLFLAHL